jgi:Amt family ammonium transporter
MDPQTVFEGLKSAENYTWTLVSAGFVFSMQFGFLLVEAGFTQFKHSINVAFKNMADFVVAVILFWMFGFALMFARRK